MSTHRLLTLLLLLGLPLLAQAQDDDDLPPFLDEIELEDGRRIEGAITSEGEAAIEVRVDSETKHKLRRADVKNIVYREQSYLDQAAQLLQAGEAEKALRMQERVAKSTRHGGKWKRAAEKVLRATLVHVAASRFADIIWLKDGKRLIGTIESEEDGTIRVRLRLGVIRYQAGEIKEVLRKEQATLAIGAKLEADGALEEAIARYRKIYEGEKVPERWQRKAGDRLAVALGALAEDARRRDDLEQAKQMLARARKIKTSGPEAGRALDVVAKRVEEQLAERGKRAAALVTAAKALLAKEAFKDAYPKLVEAYNLDPAQPGIRDLIDRCLSNIRVLNYGDFDDPLTLDPITAVKPVERRLGQFMFDSLITRDADEEFVLELAKDVKLDPSGQSFTFLLKSGIKWSDGHELTARDVEFSLRLLINPKTTNYNPSFAQFIERIDVPSPYKLVVKLRRPFYRPLSLFSFKVVPRRPFSETFIKRGDRFGRQPIGSGPFVYTKGLGSRSIELTRNEHYREKGRPYLSGVRLKQYQDRQSGRNDLENGELQLLSELRPLDVDFFEKNKNRFSVSQYRARAIYFLALNFRRPIFAETGPQLRRAFIHAIDRQRILEQYFNAGNPLKRRGGQAHSVITGPFPYNSWAYDDGVAEYKYDTALAAGLLADVLIPKGWKRDGNPRTYGGRRYWHKDNNELMLKLKYPLGDRNVEKACVFIADSLKKLGVKVRLVQTAPRKLFSEVVDEHDFDLVYTRHTFDDTYDAYPLFDPRRAGKGGSNYSGYVDPTLVRTFTRIQKTRNPNRILALARQVHRRVHDQAAMIFLWQLDQYSAHVNELRNVEVHPYLLFSQVQRWKILRAMRD